MAIPLSELLDFAANAHASDLHLHVGQPPLFRIDSVLSPVEADAVLTKEDTQKYAEEMMDDFQRSRLEEKGAVDLGYSYRTDLRFRVNIFKANQGLGLVLRFIPNKIIALDDIGLPPYIKQLLERPRGLFLVTGPTGSGKSTTLASMIDWINKNRNSHIITIEDPIEYFHPAGQALITQREVGRDVPSFAEAVHSSLRQDPDVILVGELRDLATIEAALTAAETGHLVFATVHTTGAARTVDRLVDAFPSSAKDLIRVQLAGSLLAIISQTLCQRKDSGMVAAHEILIMTNSSQQLIRENKSYRLASEIQTGARMGMITLDQSLLNLVVAGTIPAEEALLKCQSVDWVREKLKETGHIEA
jgi:twitching motility protein PilT